MCQRTLFPLQSIPFLSLMPGPDSSAIGLIQIFKNDPRFITTHQNLQLESEKYVNKYVHCEKSDSFSVIMVLKKFWISTDVHKFDERRVWDIDDDTSKNINVSLFAKVEFYLCKDSGYYALYRFDSVFSVKAKKSMNIAGNIHTEFVSHLVQDALEISLSELEAMDSRWNSIISSRRRFTWQEIEAHQRKDFEIPVLKDSSLVPGVYLTFEEFKTNGPSAKEFQVTKDKLNDVVTVKQPDGRQIVLRDAWGYCDSSNHIYIRSNHNYFVLQRRQNAFYIYGSNHTRHDINAQPTSMPFGSSPQYMPMGGSRTENFTLLLKPFQLDWDSGDLD